MDLIAMGLGKDFSFLWLLCAVLSCIWGFDDHFPHGKLLDFIFGSQIGNDSVLQNVPHMPALYECFSSGDLASPEKKTLKNDQLNKWLK